MKAPKTHYFRRTKEAERYQKDELCLNYYDRKNQHLFGVEISINRALPLLITYGKETAVWSIRSHMPNRKFLSIDSQ